MKEKLKFQIISAKLDAAELILNRTAIYEPYISNQEFLKIVGMLDRDAQTIRGLNHLPFVKTNGTILYKLSDVKDYVSRVYGPKTSK